MTLVVPVADNEISFAVSDNAAIIGIGNGDPSSHEPDKATRRRAFGGLCQVILQATDQAGEIHLDVTSPGLRAAGLTVIAEPCAVRASVDSADL